MTYKLGDVVSEKEMLRIMDNLMAEGKGGGGKQ